MKQLKIVVVSFVALLAVQCQKDTIDEVQGGNQPSLVNSSIPSKVVQGLKNMGFDTNQEIKETADGYLVEGDIIVPKISINNANENDESIAKQNRWINIIRCDLSKDITVRNRVGGIKTQVENALNDWNKVNGSFLKFRLVEDNSEGRPDINIRFLLGNAGQAELPRENNPGSFVDIDPQVWYDAADNRRDANRTIRYVIRHELGHAIGFNHTNETIGIRVTGTPERDDKSVMNSNTSLQQVIDKRFEGLTANDRKALRKIYGGEQNDNICF